jgi:hypothetical protein
MKLFYPIQASYLLCDDPFCEESSETEIAQWVERQTTDLTTGIRFPEETRDFFFTP